MPARDQLEILSPEGRITFYDLDPARGITNIGRHPDNDIVIDGPNVAEFHAVIDHRAWPYQLILLAEGAGAFVAGHPAPANTAIPLQNWESLEFDGYSIVFVLGPAPEGEPAQSAADATLEEGEPRPDGQPAPEPAAEPLAPALEIALEPAPPDLTVDPGQTALCRLTVRNLGPEPADLQVDVGGLDPAWVSVSPSELSLGPGRGALVTISFAPLREAAARAGLYLVSLVVTAPARPGWSASADLNLTINPFYEFAAGELSPRAQTLAWNQATATAAFEVANRGNSAATFRLSGESEQGRCRFEFLLPDDNAPQPRQADLRVPPGAAAEVAVRVVPFNRHLIGLGAHAYFFNVVVAPAHGAQTPRSLPGQAHFRPLIGPWPVALAVALAALLLVIGFRPAIYEFAAAPGQVSAGDQVTLRWSASPFARLRIDPDLGAVEGPEGALTVSVPDNVVYTLTAENALAWIMPGWFRATRQARVLVDPVLPGIRFTVDRDRVAPGEAVTLAWQVFDATELVLLVNGVPQAIAPGEHRSSRAFVVDRDTTFVLQARNRFTGIDGVSASLTVRLQQTGAAATPAATPGGALPVIERFDVTPLEILPGQQVRLEWTVTGVERVTIEPLAGSYPPSGTLIEAPQQTVAYVLRASNELASVSLVRQVTVVGGLGVPGQPVIESFTASPSQVAPGSPEAGAITLAWTVSGPITDVALSGPGLEAVNQLPAQGSRVVSVTADSVFTLTASNGSQTAVETVQVLVAASPPSLSGLNPVEATAGGAGLTLSVMGANFVNGSVVQWNGAARPTTFISSSQLSAAISAADLTSAGTASISVVNPPPGGGVSNSLPLTVLHPAPAIASLAPTQAVAGGPGFNLQINGTGFSGQSLVRWNGVERPVLSAGPTQLTIAVSSADLAAPGNVTISVVNPAPGGGAAAVVLPVVAATATPTLTPTPTATATPTLTPTP